MSKTKELNDYQEALARRLPGVRHQKSVRRAARLVYDRQGEDAMVAFLDGKEVDEPYTLQPPAKCHILAVSRPIEEWPIARVTMAVQEHVYALPVHEVEKSRPETTEGSRSAWFKNSGVSNHGVTHAQTLNAILKNAYNVYNGVIKKVENRNAKKRDSLAAKNKSRERKGLPHFKADPPELATDEQGYLLQPPSPNSSVYLVQQHLRTPQIDLPSGYTGPVVDPRSPIPSLIPIDRLAIPPGQPGYVPLHDREKLTSNKHRRMKLPKSLRAQGALPVCFRVFDDWAVVDGRGLLRHAQYRRLAPKNVSIAELLELYTGDPVIDIKRNLMTFRFAEAVVEVTARKIVEKYHNKYLLKLTEPKGKPVREIGLVSIDLNVQRLIALAIYRVHQTGESQLALSPCLHREILPAKGLGDFDKYKSKFNQLTEEILTAAVQTLTSAQQEEYQRYVEESSHEAKADLCLKYSITPHELAWDKMTSSTQYISRWLRDHGWNASDFTQITKGRKKVERLWSDSRWAQELKPKLSNETRRKLEDAKHDLQRANPEWQRLAKRKQEYSRHLANTVLSMAREYTACETVVIAIENLPMKGGFVDGNGSRESGWDNFFTHKKENRWMIKDIHKALSDLAPNRGVHVLEVNPQYTSQTCPECGHRDKANRDPIQRERFCCTHCGAQRHADLEVATHNIAMVATTGKSLTGKSLAPQRLQEAAE